MKLQRKPVPLIYPNPVVLVTSVDEKGKPDVITVTLAGSCCIQPPIISIGVGRNQYSKGLIEAAEEFVVNIPTEDQLAQVEYCGLVSGRSVDKFLETGFRLRASSNVRPPLIDECPVNLECRVVEKLPLGTNLLFLGEVLCLHVDEDVLDEKGGVDLSKAKPITFNLTNAYWGAGSKLQDYGYTKREPK